MIETSTSVLMYSERTFFVIKYLLYVPLCLCQYTLVKAVMSPVKVVYVGYHKSRKEANNRKMAHVKASQQSALSLQLHAV